MLANRGEITCECGKRIEQCHRGWIDPLTAEIHVCEEYWEIEIARILKGVESWEEMNVALKKIKYPVRTFIGQVIENGNIVQKVLDKYGAV